MRALISVAWICLGLQAAAQTPATGALDVKKKVTVSAHGTRLQRLFQLGIDSRIPMGIVIVNDGGLCGEREARVYTEVPLGNVLDNILFDSAYKWESQDGQLRILPAGETSAVESKVLRTKLPTFGAGFDTTIQGLGIVLAGRIVAILHRGQGYAGNILSSPDAEIISPFLLHDVTVGEAADHIVSRGGKGVWILSEPKDGDVELRAFGYKDDFRLLNEIKCFDGGR